MRRSGRSMRWVLVLLLAALASTAGHAQRRERKRIDREEITNLEEKWRQAQLADDIPAMDKLLSDEFLGITAAGQVVTKVQQLDRMRTHRLAIARLDISDTKIKISGNVAVVTSLAQIDGTADGAPLRGSFRYIRVYHRVGRGDWKITNFEATKVGGGGVKSPPARAPQATGSGPRGFAPSSPGAFRAEFLSPRSLS